MLFSAYLFRIEAGVLTVALYTACLNIRPNITQLLGCLDLYWGSN